jgi:hypothetical protein
MKKRTIIYLVVGIFCAVCLIIISIPSTLPEHTYSFRAACINNLRLIDGAKQEWAINNKKSSNAVPTWHDLLPLIGGIYRTNVPTCPANGTYSIHEIKDLPTCTIPGHALED